MSRGDIPTTSLPDNILHLVDLSRGAFVRCRGNIHDVYMPGYMCECARARARGSQTDETRDIRRQHPKGGGEDIGLETRIPPGGVPVLVGGCRGALSRADVSLVRPEASRIDPSRFLHGLVSVRTTGRPPLAERAVESSRASVERLEPLDLSRMSRVPLPRRSRLFVINAGVSNARRKIEFRSNPEIFERFISRENSKVDISFRFINSCATCVIVTRTKCPRHGNSILSFSLSSYFKLIRESANQ